MAQSYGTACQIRRESLCNVSYAFSASFFLLTLAADGCKEHDNNV